MNLFYVYYFFFHCARLPRSEHHLCWQLLMELLVAHTNCLLFLVFYSQNFSPIFTLQKQTILFLTIQNVCMDFVSHHMPIRLGLNFFLSIFQYTFMFLFYTITPTFTAISLCVWVCFFLCSIQHAIKLSIQTHWKVNRMRKKKHALTATKLYTQRYWTEMPSVYRLVVWLDFAESQAAAMYAFECVFLCVFVCVFIWNFKRTIWDNNIQYTRFHQQIYLNCFILTQLNYN